MLAKRGVELGWQGVGGRLKLVVSSELKRACARSEQFFALFNVIKMSLNCCRCTTLRIRNVRFMSNCNCWATVATVLFAFGITFDALRMLYANLIKEFKHLCLSKVCGQGPHHHASPRPLGQFDSNSFFVDYFAKCLLGKCTMQSDGELLKWKGIRLKNVRNNKNLFITLLLPFSLSLSFSFTANSFRKAKKNYSRLFHIQYVQWTL